MTIGAVVVTHNSESHIEKCIESLKREGLQTIVVDSASTDGTKDKLSHLKTETIILSENRGFGHAVNEGVKNVNTDYVLFINPDAYLESGALEGFTDFIQQHPNIGIIGLSLWDEEGKSEIASFGNEPTLQRLLTRHRFNTGPLTEAWRVDWVSGGAMLVKKSLFEELGGFDEGFFLYWEDVDICRRVRQVGYSVWVYPQAKAIHARGASQADMAEKTRIYDMSADRYYKKHYSTTIWLLQGILRKIYRIARPTAH